MLNPIINIIVDISHPQMLSFSYLEPLTGSQGHQSFSVEDIERQSQGIEYRGHVNISCASNSHSPHHLCEDDELSLCPLTPKGF